jgi:hypothetical protein
LDSQRQLHGGSVTFGIPRYRSALIFSATRRPSS